MGWKHIDDTYFSLSQTRAKAKATCPVTEQKRQLRKSRARTSQPPNTPSYPWDRLLARIGLISHLPTHRSDPTFNWCPWTYLTMRDEQHKSVPSKMKKSHLCQNSVGTVVSARLFFPERTILLIPETFDFSLQISSWQCQMKMALCNWSVWSCVVQKIFSRYV